MALSMSSNAWDTWEQYYRRLFSLNESLGIFPRALLNKLLRSGMPLGPEALPSLSRASLHFYSWVLRLLTDVTAIACLSQTPPLTTPLSQSQARASISLHPHPLLHLSQPSPVFCSSFCKTILMSPPETSSITSQQSSHSRLFVLYQSLAIGLTLLLFFLMFCLKKISHS